MCPWLWGLLCFWDTQIANPPHSSAVGCVWEFVDCCISISYYVVILRSPPTNYCGREGDLFMKIYYVACYLTMVDLCLEFTEKNTTWRINMRDQTTTFL